MTWSTRTNAPRRLTGRAAQARRARILARDRVCRACEEQPSTVVDHIVNLATSGRDDRLVTDAELRGLCKACHDAKTHRESMASRPSRRRAAEPHPGELDTPRGWQGGRHPYDLAIRESVALGISQSVTPETNRGEQ